MFYFDEDHMEHGFNEPTITGTGAANTNGGDQPSQPAFSLPPSNAGSNQSGGDNMGQSSSDAFSTNDTSPCSDDCPDEHFGFGDMLLAHARSNPNSAKFNDCYKLMDDDLGAGAYACVRTAISLASGKEFAVKLVDKHEPGHTRSRIRREVEIFNMCKGHPNIVQLIDWFETDHHCYMVFEKMHGGPLLNRIQRKGCFTEQEASLVTRDIASALKFLHDRGVAHRDVKPENILCTDKERVSPVKLCDLDLASMPVTTPGSNVHATLSAAAKTLSSRGALHVVQSEPNLASPVGSAEFMAPEVVDAFVGDSLRYDKRCDMWSLGVIIYIMICGYPPFYGECERAGDCGWDQGKACSDCQDNLFQRIQRGEFDFPEEEWGDVSTEAKDLISHLLVRNVRLRYTADDVLRHPWVRHGAPGTLLQTASNLLRNDSTRDMHQMNEHFNAINRRLTVGHISTMRVAATMEPTIQESSSGLGSSVEVSPDGSPPPPMQLSPASSTQMIGVDELSAKLEHSVRLEQQDGGEEKPLAEANQNSGDGGVGNGMKAQPEKPQFFLDDELPASALDDRELPVVDSGIETMGMEQFPAQSQLSQPPSHSFEVDYSGGVMMYQQQQPAHFEHEHFVNSHSGTVYYGVPPQNCSYPTMMMNPHQPVPRHLQMQHYQLTDHFIPHQQQPICHGMQLPANCCPSDQEQRAEYAHEPALLSAKGYDHQISQQLPYPPHHPHHFNHYYPHQNQLIYPNGAADTGAPMGYCGPQPSLFYYYVMPAPTDAVNG